MAETPGAMREQAIGRISSQYQAIADHVAEVSKSDSDDSRRQIANNYVKNIYRFFKLFRRKGEFFDPFAKGFSIRGIKFFNALTDDAEMLGLLAEFSFKTGLYDDAAGFYSALAALGGEHVSVSVLQKAGFSYEKTGDTDNAERMYRDAMNLAPDNVWTLRRLAGVLRHGGRLAEAAKIYTRLVEADGENFDLLYAASLTLIEAGEYAAAVVCLQKMNYLEDGSRRSLRPLAWALFLDGQYEESAGAYTKLLAGSPNSNDYLNHGHLMLALGRTRDAIMSYKFSLGELPDAEAMRKFEAAMDADSKFLHDAGLTPGDVARIIDAVAYSVRSNDFGVPFL
ncbi:MAG: tetratricopeptide repeat protein, partial [Muribaculum sp.]|nr:tetratricopeptide repeat protein [Muribaculum sp.]